MVVPEMVQGGDTVADTVDYGGVEEKEPMTCPNCDGAGYVSCDVCEGEGFVESKEEGDE